MRRLWLLLDLNDIELQARYIRSEANEPSGASTRSTGSRRRSQRSYRGTTPSGGMRWRTYDWSGESNWINPPWGLLDEVAHKLREEGAGGMVVAPYWPGQSQFRELEAIAVIMPRRRDLSAPSRLGGSELLGASSWDAVMFQIPVRPYGPKSEKFKDFCKGEGREWLPASEDTVRLYLAMLLGRGGIQATSLQPCLSAINNYPEDMGLPGPAKGRSVSRAVKGMARLQVAASEATGVTVTERTWLPARHACARPATGTSLQQENVLMNEDCVTVVLTREKGRNHKLKKRQLSIPWWGVERLRELLELWTRCKNEAWRRSDTDLGNEWLQRALGSVGCVPPEGGHFSAHSTRKGATTCARAVRVVMEKRARNVVNGALLSNRYTTICIRAGMEADATVPGGAEALRAKLSYIEEKMIVHGDGRAGD
ncbi:hypothetical protein CYMTET_31282 [Cymbomonas tetramitiformis]|uniref:Uncharacterized protein n=1 Tax=Cymbomonas tetramitiformis TaxID=36881 RepID=A0AAE0FI82_9CHLO|nr:hypothetical protein CYMTET_31282 [Cymbomonas tetramitiformis]